MLSPLQRITARQFFEEVVPGLLASDTPTSDIGRVQFSITPSDAEPGGTWLVDFDERSLKPGSSGVKPHVVVRATALDFLALVAGTMTGADGVLSSRLGLTGDLTRITRLLQTIARQGPPRRGADEVPS